MSSQQPNQPHQPPSWAQQPPQPSYGQPQPPQWGQQPQAGPQWGAPQPPAPKKHRGLKIALGIVGGIIAISVIASLASSGKKDGTNSSAPQGTPAGTAAATTTPGAAATPAKKKPTTAAYGDTYTYTDGLAISVSKVATYTPSQYAAGTHPGDEAVVLTVKITNGAKKPFDTSLVSVNVKAGADGAATEQIFDDTSGIGFSGTVVSGATATAKFEYDIPKGATGKLDIEVQPDSGLEYDSWHWVGPMP